MNTVPFESPQLRNLSFHKQWRFSIALSALLMAISIEPSLAVNLQRIGHIGQSIDTVVAEGNFAYIGEGAGLRVLDVSNPAAPVPRGRIGLSAYCFRVAKKGDYIFCAVLDKGLQVVDVSNPDLLQVVYSYEVSWMTDTGVWWSDLEIAGNRLYVSSGNGGLQSGVHVFDIANPAAPVLIGHFAGTRV